MSLDGVVALVTGGSRGIGRAAAQRLAGSGATVVVHYGTNKAAAQETVDSLGAGGHEMLPADLKDPAQIKELVDQVVARHGTIGVLVNNAGTYEPHPVLETSYEQWQDVWRRTMDTNLTGPANLIHEVVPHMVAAGGGRIVNITSRGAFRGEPTHPAYGASKAGLNSLSQSLAKALGQHNIFVTAVAPGYVDTDMAAPYLNGPRGEAIRNETAIGRIADVDEVAKLVVFLATPGTESMTGGVIDINGASYLRT
ncbi:NAD(P)-dependent dehydrogenase, short-chain alcohol dehydrogenase family [Asanoa ishikariensis]|uniref:NAD(P)-dependent dehydrogenase, short-chain alcohol dehydrogenase family n=1 Tax=Asanoa ishikariensis TaxID=137265 RepID=A0A1H3QX04_9ACTN|nr:SDR family oxidoreductase [Asanoa ishikariensis]SDZ17565.1 NAD(P)-dependent dehydrogenase, short-chain alcohol dehydrogenase family [Asanoa ishikariensis]